MMGWGWGYNQYIIVYIGYNDNRTLIEMIYTNEIVMTLSLMILLILHNMHEVFGTVEKLGNST